MSPSQALAAWQLAFRNAAGGVASASGRVRHLPPPSVSKIEEFEQARTLDFELDVVLGRCVPDADADLDWVRRSPSHCLHLEARRA